MPDYSTRLAAVQAAIDSLLASIADSAVQEYQLPDGRKITRADFPATLDALQRMESVLTRRVSNQSGNRFRAGKLTRRSY